MEKVIIPVIIGAIIGSVPVLIANFFELRKSKNLEKMSLYKLIYEKKINLYHELMKRLVQIYRAHGSKDKATFEKALSSLAFFVFENIILWSDELWSNVKKIPKWGECLDSKVFMTETKPFLKYILNELKLEKIETDSIAWLKFEDSK